MEWGGRSCWGRGGAGYFGSGMEKVDGTDGSVVYICISVYVYVYVYESICVGDIWAQSGCWCLVTGLEVVVVVVAPP